MDKELQAALAEMMKWTIALTDAVNDPDLTDVTMLIGHLSALAVAQSGVIAQVCRVLAERPTKMSGKGGE